MAEKYEILHIFSPTLKGTNLSSKLSLLPSLRVLTWDWPNIKEEGLKEIELFVYYFGVSSNKESVNSADYGIWDGSSTSKWMGNTSYNEVERMIFFISIFDRIVVVSLKSNGCGIVKS